MAEEIERLTQQLDEKTRRCSELQAGMDAISREIAERLLARSQYEEREQTLSRKFQDKLDAAKQELRLLKRGGTSGCPCPIGQCLNFHNQVRQGACWLQWAEGWVAKRMGEARIDSLRAAASHPLRVSMLPGPPQKPDQDARDKLPGPSEAS